MNTDIDHEYLPESFAPETVDNEIARYLGTEPPFTGTAARDAYLIHTLAAYHTLPAAADASLARVRARLRTVAEASDDSDASRRGDTTDIHIRTERSSRPQPSQPSQPSQAWRDQSPPSSRSHSLTLLAMPLRAVAAVLVVALLVGGFIAVLHLHGGRQIATAPAWQNVAITRANTQGQALDFDPTQVQVEYAISQVDGTIYALGANHLWYSVDSGATYRPFTPSLPTLPRDMSNLKYAIGTVPGLRGVFASATAGDAYPTIYYAEAGTGSWRTLNISNAAHPVTQAASSVTFSSADIWKAIFYEHGYGKSVQARAVGNWLILLAQRNDVEASMLIGTPDFGTTWYALRTTLPETCVQFAVNPADARELYCLTISNTVEQTADGGLTWKPMTRANGDTMTLYTSIWASTRAVYSFTGDRVEQAALARHSLGAGDWVVTARMPTLSEGGGAEVIGVSPDDIVYAAAVLEGRQTRVRVSTLAPGARQFAPVGYEATLTLPASAIFFDVGGLYAGDAPAIYVHTALSSQVTDPQPLYRLALPPAPDNSPQRNVRPFVTPTSPPTATPQPHGACTSAPGDVANIQSGGYGADLDTFAQRWGPSDGVAGGSVYFGKWADGTSKMRVADALPSNHRVYMMGYTVDKAQDMAMTQAVTLARTILPKDATPIAHTQQGNEVIVSYCSAALIAAFPASVQDINGPLPHNGWVVVSYLLRNDGNISDIGFGPQA